jgi:hypothetical protein
MTRKKCLSAPLKKPNKDESESTQAIIPPTFFNDSHERERGKLVVTSSRAAFVIVFSDLKRNQTFFSSVLFTPLCFTWRIHTE